MKILQPLFNQALLVGWRFQNCSLYEDEKKATLFSQWMVMSGNRLEGWVFVWKAIVPMCRVVPEGWCSSIGGFIHPFLFIVSVSVVVELCVNCLHPQKKKKKLCARARVFVCVLFLRLVLSSRSLAPSLAQRRRRRRRRGPTTAAAVVAYLVCFPSFLPSFPPARAFLLAFRFSHHCHHSFLPVCVCCLVIYELRLHRLQSLYPPLSFPPFLRSLIVLFCLSLSRNLKFCPHLFVCLFVV
jgi:cytochrome bd-type quinol oxidase subunit 2